MIVFRILGVSNSKVGKKIAYTERGFTWFFPGPFQSSHDHFFPKLPSSYLQNHPTIRHFTDFRN